MEIEDYLAVGIVLALLLLFLEQKFNDPCYASSDRAELCQRGDLDLKYTQ
jgi:hypothetical protein